MRKLNFTGCIISGLSAGCLFIIMIILGAIYLYQNNKIPQLENISVNEEPISHLEEKNKSIKYQVGLIADTENDWISFENAVNLFNTKNLGYVFHLGDVTHLGVKEDLVKSKNILDKLQVDYSIVPGDRDLWKSNGTRNFLEIFPKNYGIIDIKDDRYLYIDNSDEYRGIDQEQMAFIEKELPEADYIVLHNPLHINDSILGFKVMGQYSEEVSKQRDELLRKVKSSNVKAVFAGDQHVFSENFDDQKNSLVHYIIGSLNKDRSIAPTISILTVYDDGDYYLEKLIVQ